MIVKACNDTHHKVREYALEKVDDGLLIVRLTWKKDGVLLQCPEGHKIVFDVEDLWNFKTWQDYGIKKYKLQPCYLCWRNEINEWHNGSQDSPRPACNKVKMTYMREAGNEAFFASMVFNPFEVIAREFVEKKLIISRSLAHLFRKRVGELQEEKENKQK